MQALLFILNTLLTLVVVAFLLRVLMPLVRADFRNPIGAGGPQDHESAGAAAAPGRAAVEARFDVAAVVALLIVQFAGTALLRAGGRRGFRP